LARHFCFCPSISVFVRAFRFSRVNCHASDAVHNLSIYRRLDNRPISSGTSKRHIHPSQRIRKRT
jgi:hypothetical protein